MKNYLFPTNYLRKCTNKFPSALKDDELFL